MDSFYIKIDKLQPSQLYINKEKLKKVDNYLSSINLDEMTPLPVKKIGNNLFLTDGHTRAYVLNKKGKENVKVYYDEDELDWLQYLICVNWAKESGIHKISDLENKIIENDKYKNLWINKCEKMQEDIENDVFKYIDFEVVNNKDEKSKICYNIIDKLDNWFGKEDTNRKYAKGVREDFFLTAKIKEEAVGFISIKEHNEFTSEIYVLGILKEFHKRGIGKRLIEIAKDKLVKDKKKFLTVKTLSGSNPNKYYKKTRKFYKAMDFYPLEEMPELWSEEEPCLYMLKTLSN